MSFYTLYDEATGQILGSVTRTRINHRIPEPYRPGVGVFKSSKEEHIQGKQDRVVIEKGKPVFKKNHVAEEIPDADRSVVNEMKIIFQEQPISTTVGSIEVDDASLNRMKLFIEATDPLESIEWETADDVEFTIVVEDFIVLYAALIKFKAKRMDYLNKKARIWKTSSNYPTVEEVRDYNTWLQGAGNALSRQNSPLITE